MSSSFRRNFFEVHDNGCGSLSLQSQQTFQTQFRKHSSEHISYQFNMESSSNSLNTVQDTLRRYKFDGSSASIRTLAANLEEVKEIDNRLRAFTAETKSLKAKLEARTVTEDDKHRAQAIKADIEELLARKKRLGW